MIYLAYFLFAFSVIQLLVALSNLLFKEELKNVNSNYKGLVSVLIPARNEEKNMGNLLSDLQKQDYENIGKTLLVIVLLNEQRANTCCF